MSRVELKAALAALQNAAGFRQYVNTLESSKADVIARLISRDTPRDKWDELIAELRVYDELLRDIEKNTNR